MLTISIIIATFNAESTIAQALNSIREQTYNNIETIIVDGASTDGTLDVVKQYGDIVSKLVSEKDKGVYDAFNKGINIATGDYIYFLGSDDCLKNSDAIRMASELLLKDIKVLSFPVIMVDERTHTEFLVKNERSKDDIFSGNMLPHQGLFIRTDIMKKYLYDTNYRIVADYDFLVRYTLDGGDIVFGNTPVAYYSNGGLSSERFGSHRWNKMLYEYIQIIKEYGLDTVYLDRLLNYLLFENRTPASFYRKEVLRDMIERAGLMKIAKRAKYTKHSCQLKICRWCKRRAE